MYVHLTDEFFITLSLPFAHAQPLCLRLECRFKLVVSAPPTKPQHLRMHANNECMHTECMHAYVHAYDKAARSACSNSEHKLRETEETKRDTKRDEDTPKQSQYACMIACMHTACMQFVVLEVY